jgi:hypothetical protein
VELGAVLDPALREEPVEVTDEFGLPRSVPGKPDPGVAVPPFVLPHASDQLRGHPAVDERDRTGRPLRLPGLRDLLLTVLERSEERLRRPVTLVALDEERGRLLDVRLVERADVGQPFLTLL